ncbi:MAG: PDGLE domain-containing protein [Actinomycetota bacterium]
MKKVSLKSFLLAGLALSLILAFLISPLASSSPDGLEKVTGDEGFLETAADHTLADGPLADYGVRGVSSERLSTGFAGIVGVLITFAVGFVIFRAVRPKQQA